VVRSDTRGLLGAPTAVREDRHRHQISVEHVVTAEVVRQRSRASTLVLALILAVAAMLIFAELHADVGFIPVGKGEGWDGAQYAAMLRSGWESGGPNTALRPMFVWLALPMYTWTGHVVEAFDFNNYVYVGLLVFLLARLMDLYGASKLTCVVAIICISLSNGFQFTAYYPVSVDLAGHAIMTLALWYVITGPRWAASAASVIAILSREYAPVIIVFGVIRDLRMRVTVTRTLATYLPASIAYVLLRIVVVRSIGEGNSIQTFIDNLDFWKDPMWAALYAYFAVTAIAGVSMVIAAQPQRWWPVIREEPEWLWFAVPIAIATAVVGMDIWRYMLAWTPLAVVLLARCSREWRRGERVVFLSAIAVLTAATQWPFQRIDLTRYFTDWFPYYAWVNQAQNDVTPAMLWPAWAWRFSMVAATMLALTLYSNRRSVELTP
jgi:hypothetical protein